VHHCRGAGLYGFSYIVVPIGVQTRKREEEEPGPHVARVVGEARDGYRSVALYGIGVLERYDVDESLGHPVIVATYAILRNIRGSLIDYS